MKTYIEKRKFLRHPISVPIQLEVNREKEAIASESLDISLGGLCFLWTRKLSKGHRLQVTIPVKEKLFRISAKVAYSKEDRKTGKFKTGISFLDSPSAFRAKMAEEALEILEYRKIISEKLGKEISEEAAAKQWVSEFASRFARFD